MSSSAVVGDLHFFKVLARMLLAAQDGTGSANGIHPNIRVVLILIDHVLDAAEGSLSILADGGPHVGGGWLSLVGSLLHDHHNTFAIGGGGVVPLPQSCIEINLT
jgi:hypothetical protein